MNVEQNGDKMLAKNVTLGEWKKIEEENIDKICWLSKK